MSVFDDLVSPLQKALTCDLIHNDQGASDKCLDSATYTATYHWCKHPEGRQIVVCEMTVARLLNYTYPSACPTCKHKFGSFVELIWNIKRIGVGPHAY